MINKKPITFQILLAAIVFWMSGCLFASGPISNIDKDKFRFVVNADPQIGQQFVTNNGLKIRNELLENFVVEINEENKKSPIDFVIYNGDLVNNGSHKSFDNFSRIVSKQDPAAVLVHGNHDGHDDDPNFFKTQQELSGYKKLNYSFEYGNWYFVIIGAQQKYKTEKQKKVQLAWLENELNKAKSKKKKVLLFMHYHIMPVGLSQMEFYTYWPIEFKNKILNIITDAGNVEYVFSGHVHTGVMASIKTSLEYKGVKFINCPTPAKARPFGEEFVEFEIKKDRFFRRGFYLDVSVDGDNIKLFGKKINHSHSVLYPNQFRPFVKKSDIRNFVPELDQEPSSELKNGSFSSEFNYWSKSYRYKKEKNNSFQNIVKNNKNVLNLIEPWGAWSKDEYMESYQVVKFDLAKNYHLNYEFDTPKYSLNGAGGYIKLLFHGKGLEDSKIVIFHWGSNEINVKTMQKSWFYNITGTRPRKISNKIDFMIGEGTFKSVYLNFEDINNTQKLKVNLNKLVNDLYKTPMGKEGVVTISHGVWVEILDDQNKSFSKLIVDKVELTTVESDDNYDFLFNNEVIPKQSFDVKSPYKGDIISLQQKE